MPVLLDKPSPFMAMEILEENGKIRPTKILKFFVNFRVIIQGILSFIHSFIHSYQNIKYTHCRMPWDIAPLTGLIFY